MLKHSLRLLQAASPISKTEFLDAFSRVFPGGLQDGPLKLGMRDKIQYMELNQVLTMTGLAVSGGADSMALAVMCHEYLPRDKTELHALIVDHGLRPTSADEAQKTSETLKSRLGGSPLHRCLPNDHLN